MKNKAKTKPIFPVFSGNFLSHLKQFSSGFALPMIHPRKEWGVFTDCVFIKARDAFKDFV